MCAQNLSAVGMPEPQSILVRGVNWLGDAVMTTPALQRLRQARPEARLTLLAPEKLAGLWRGQSFLDEVLTFAPSETLWQVARRLREKRFDSAVAFPNSLRAALELWLARIPQRVGIAQPGRGLFLTRIVSPRPGAVAMRKRSPADVRRLVAVGLPPPAIPAAAHHVHHYLHLTAAMGASSEPLAPRLEVSWGTIGGGSAKIRFDNWERPLGWFESRRGIRSRQTLAS